MDRRLRYSDLFEADILEAAGWYADRDRQLGIEFTVEVESAISAIVADPLRRTPVDFGIRYWPLSRFPHLVFYEVTPHEIFLIGVMHPSRDMAAWLGNRD